MSHRAIGLPIRDRAAVERARSWPRLREPATLRRACHARARPHAPLPAWRLRGTRSSSPLMCDLSRALICSALAITIHSLLVSRSGARASSVGGTRRAGYRTYFWPEVACCCRSWRNISLRSLPHLAASSSRMARTSATIGSSFIVDVLHQFLGSADGGRLETGQAARGLDERPCHRVREMAEIPGYEVLDPVGGGDSDVWKRPAQSGPTPSPTSPECSVDARPRPRHAPDAPSGS